MAKVDAKYTGEWPNRCSGHWVLIVDGQDVSHYIPENLRENHHMNTYDSYERKYLRNGKLKHETFVDGLEYEDWIELNKEWLSKISGEYDVWEDIYDAINKEDWRHGCCGGCI